ncbi:YoaK family protein [Salinicola halimionae]|uniref:YoaK family protein n=1 Tax=Salinicola halimionae TaxID=1949081 RepID=UPI000DA113D9|nr:YoaK family protein [Salinicola halimionae]
MKHEDTVLAGIAGYVDTLGFVALFGLFTAHVTGNFVLIGAQAGGFAEGALIKLMAFPAFVIGVVLSSFLVRWLPRPLAPSVLYGTQTVLLLAFCLMGIRISPVVDPNDLNVILCGMTGATAMGIQNAHSRLIVRVGVPNTVMTGNVTQAVLDIVELVGRRCSQEVRQAARGRLSRTLPAVAAFGLGAIAGAVAYREMLFLALLLPVALLATMTLIAWRRRPLPQSESIGAVNER